MLSLLNPSVAVLPPVALVVFVVHLPLGRNVPVTVLRLLVFLSLLTKRDQNYSELLSSIL